MRRLLVVPALTAALVVGLAGCGGDDDEKAGDGPATTTTEASAPSDPDPAGSSTTAASDGSTTTAGDGPTTTGAPGDLPGEPIDIYPYAGAALAVVGVAAADTLNVRSGPGTDFAVVTELDPVAEGITATGQNRILDDDSFWAEVEVEGATGWVNGRFVAEPGGTTDVTGEVGDVSAATMEALAQAVAAGRVSGEGPTPTVTVVAGGEDEVTVDVIGFADDAQKGERLHVVATGTAEGFTVSAVEATALCSRGVSDGLCV